MFTVPPVIVERMVHADNDLDFQKAISASTGYPADMSVSRLRTGSVAAVRRMIVTACSAFLHEGLRQRECGAPEDVGCQVRPQRPMPMPLSDGVSQAIIVRIKETAPGKPIRIRWRRRTTIPTTSVG